MKGNNWRHLNIFTANKFTKSYNFPRPHPLTSSHNLQMKFVGSFSPLSYCPKDVTKKETTSELRIFYKQIVI